jgi:hypothetical protein
VGERAELESPWPRQCFSRRSRRLSSTPAVDDDRAKDRFFVGRVWGETSSKAKATRAHIDFYDTWFCFFFFLLLVVWDTPLGHPLPTNSRTHALLPKHNLLPPPSTPFDLCLLASVAPLTNLTD